MSDPGVVLLDATLTAAIVVASALTLLCSYRIIRGPTVPDRVIALETIATNVVAIAVLVALETAQPFYVIIAIVLAIVGFTSTVAAAKYVVEGEVIS